MIYLSREGRGIIIYMVTIDQIIAEKLGSWYVGEWPIGNFSFVLSHLSCR